MDVNRWHFRFGDSMTDRSQASRTILTVLVLLGLAVPATSQEGPKTGGPPFRVGGEVSRPEILSSTKPVYTELATEPAIPLARIYLLLKQGHLQEAWRKALEVNGPSRYESLACVGAFAWGRAMDSRQDAQRRAEEIELGLQAEAAAMAENPEG